MSAIHHHWDSTPGEQITGEVFRRYISGDQVTVARFQLAKGGIVPMHSHPNEQVSCVLSGALQFRFEDRTVVVGANQVMQIPGGVPHEVSVLEDALVIDVFSPVREDWIAGTDTYFNRPSA